MPEELRPHPHWVLWRWEARRGNWAKAPYQASGRYARLNDPSTWLSFDAVMDAFPNGGFDGIGFVLTADDPYAMVDLDHCINPTTGKTHAWARDIVERLRSYTEITPSGEGLRVIVKAILPPGSRRRTVDSGGGVEMYDRARYMTVTGHHLPGTPGTIETRDAEINNLHHRLFAEDPGALSGRVRSESTNFGVANENILKKARSAKNREKFCALFDRGDVSGYASASEADLALCALLAFWIRGDAQQVDRLFRSSALYRPEKWDARHYADGRTYGQGTVDKAIATLIEGHGTTTTSARAPVRVDVDRALTIRQPAQVERALASKKWTPGTTGAYPDGRRWRAGEDGYARPLPEDAQ